MSIPQHILVRFDLVSGRDERFDPPPGRIFLVGPAHTFEDLGDAVNHAFGRWDMSPRYLFELPDGQRVAVDAEPGEQDAESILVMDRVRRGDVFGFEFDPDGAWRHNAEVLDEDAEPEDGEDTFEIPPMPVAVWGWGTLPDQYGRQRPDDDTDDD